MKVLIYILACIPTVLMIFAGIILCATRRDSTMRSHHHAKNFNINHYSQKIMPLFTVTGILFSLGGIILATNHIIAGILVLFAVLIMFIISFAVIQKNTY